MMYKSESIVSNLLMEVDSLSYRMTNIEQVYSNTSHLVLRERLINENKSISLRLKEIFLIAKELKDRTNEKISCSNLLLEKCKRTIFQRGLGKNLFFH